MKTKADKVPNTQSDMDNEHKIHMVGGRVALRRYTCGLDQKSFAEQIQEHSSYSVSPPLVSAWETGRRAIPTKYNDVFPTILGCTLQYLQGLTDDPNSEEAMINRAPDEENSSVIRYDQLERFDGRPLFVVYTDYTHEPEWVIYNAEKHTFISKEGAKRINPDCATFHVNIPDYHFESDRAKKALILAQVNQMNKVFVLMNSPNEGIRNKYNGWYVHNEKHTALINPWSGLSLPYEGINISYKAYAEGISQNLTK